MKIWLLDFHCFGLLFSPVFYEFSAKNLAQKVNAVYLSEITAMMLTFRDLTTDVTYRADVTFFLEAVTDKGIFSVPSSCVLLL